MRHFISFGLLLSLALGGCSGAAAGETAPEETADDGADDTSGAEPAHETPVAPLVADSLLLVGAEAPDFRLRDQNGMPRTLSAERGHVVVVYFYPRDATPGCTTEACAFRDAWDRYEDANVVLLGISVDSVESHLAFAEEHELPFSLLADVNGETVRAYGVAEGEGDTVYARRVTYVIDAEGTVAHRFENVDPGVHADEVLAVIEAL